MRLLYLVHQFFPKYYTGTERLTLDIASQMQRLGHHPTVITYEPGPANVSSGTADQFQRITDRILVRRYSYAGVPVVALKHTSQADVSEIFHPEVEKAYRRLGISCDLVHIFHPMWLSSIGIACKDSGIPVIMTLTDAWLLCPRGPLLDLRLALCNGPERGERCWTQCRLRAISRYQDAKCLFETVDKVTVGSSFLASLFDKNGWHGSLRIIPHSVNYAFVKPNHDSNKPRLTLGYIGTISWHKGLHVLIKALRKVSNPDITLKIYGAPTDLDYYRTVLELAREDGRIQFLDPFDLADSWRIMKDISVLVVPSTYSENYPLVLLLALAYRVPAIASNIGGIPEIIKHRVNGFLFDVGRSDQLAEWIEQIVRDPNLLETARNNIVPPRRIESEALDYENMYRSLVRY